MLRIVQPNDFYNSNEAVNHKAYGSSFFNWKSKYMNFYIGISLPAVFCIVNITDSNILKNDSYIKNGNPSTYPVKVNTKL